MKVHTEYSESKGIIVDGNELNYRWCALKREYIPGIKDGVPNCFKLCIESPNLNNKFCKDHINVEVQKVSPQIDFKDPTQEVGRSEYK